MRVFQFLIIACLFLITACGKYNVFKETVDNSSTGSYENKLNYADSKESYQQIADDILVELSNPNITNEDKQQLNIQYSQAKLGAVGLSFLDIAADIKSLQDSLNTASTSNQQTSTKNENIFQLLDSILEDVSTADLRSITDRFNEAQEISKITAITLTKDDQLIRGLVNYLMSSKLINIHLIVSSSKVELKVPSTNYSEIIIDLMSPPNQFKSLDVYSTHAIEAINSAGIFSDSDSVKVELDKIKNIIAEIKLLYEALILPNGFYKTFSVGTNAIQRETNIESAVNDIVSSNL